MDCATSWISTDQLPFTTNRGTAHRCCKVVGCHVDLEVLNNPYCRKRRVCEKHMKADAVMCEGCGDQLWRFCQQCGKLELLSMFDAHKRSCRISLAKRRLREDGRLNDACLSRISTKKARQQQLAEIVCKQPMKSVENLQHEADLDMASHVSCPEVLGGPCGSICNVTAPMLVAPAEMHTSTNSSQTETDASSALSGSHHQQQMQQLDMAELAMCPQQLDSCNWLAQGTLSSAVVDTRAAIASAAAALDTLKYPKYPITQNGYCSVADSVALESLLEAELVSCAVTGKEQLADMTDLEIEQLLETELLAVLNQTRAADVVMWPAAQSTLTCQQQQHPTAVASAGPAPCWDDRAAMQSAKIRLLQEQLRQVQQMLTRLQQLRSQA